MCAAASLWVEPTHVGTNNGCSRRWLELDPPRPPYAPEGTHRYSEAASTYTKESRQCQ
jgi:hypothetical protein